MVLARCGNHHAVVGVVQLLQGQFLFALALFVVACLLGPGGYSVFRSRRT